MIRFILITLLLASFNSFGQTYASKKRMLSGNLSEIVVTCFPKSRFTKNDFTTKGIFVKYETKNWIFVSLTKKQLASFSEITSPFYAESNKAEALGDSVRSMHFVNEVHQGASNLPNGFTGKNVVVGIIDIGTDFNHPDFKTKDGKTRIYRYWDQTKTTKTTKSPSPYNYGEAWKNSEIDNKSCTATGSSHGSTVAGIAVGNGLANGTNKGMAPEATIIIVKTNLNADNWTLTIADACEYIFKVADSLKMPAVINISAGTQFGSHDGKDPASEKMESLLDEKNGRIIVASAGNSGNSGKYHVHGEISSDTTFCWIKNNPGGKLLGKYSVYIDLWSDSLDFKDVHFSMGANLPSDNFKQRGFGKYLTFNQIIGKYPFTDTIYNASKQKIGLVDYYPEIIGDLAHLEITVSDFDSSNYNLNFSTTGKGNYDAWSGSKNKLGNYFLNDFITVIPSSLVYPKIKNYFLADSLQSVWSSFISSEKVVTVGNVQNREFFESKNGLTTKSITPRGKLSINSSKGPNRKKILKPTICAAGDGTLASGYLVDLNNVNQNIKIDKGGWHFANGGTSMSSPVVAGIAALYLEKCSEASYNDFLDAVSATAFKDEFSGPLANYAYGNGKINALNLLLSTHSPIDYSGNNFICSDSTQVFLNEKKYSAINWFDGSTQNQKKFGSPGFYSLSYYDHHNKNCISKDSIKIAFPETKVNVTIESSKDTLNCLHNSVSLFAKGALFYEWSDGLNKTNDTNTVISPQKYIVIGTDKYECTDTAEITILKDALLPLITLNFIGDSLLNCLGNKLKIEASGALTYSWNVGSSPLNSINTFDQPSLVIVTGTNLNGCSSQKSIQIKKIETPEKPIKQKTELKLIFLNCDNLKWYRNDSLIASGNLSIPYLQGGSYKVSSEIEGCISYSDIFVSTLTINTHVEPKIKIAPNPFENHFVIHSSIPNSDMSVKITDVLGNTISVIRNESTVYFPTELSAGSYTIILTINEHVFFYKLIKN